MSPSKLLNHHRCISFKYSKEVQYGQKTSIAQTQVSPAILLLSLLFGSKISWSRMVQFNIVYQQQRVWKLTCMEVKGERKRDYRVAAGDGSPQPDLYAGKGQSKNYLQKKTFEKIYPGVYGIAQKNP